MKDRVYEKNFGLGRWFYGGLQFYAYQLAFGISLKYLDCLKSVMIRMYFMCFKIWFNFKILKGGK